MQMSRKQMDDLSELFNIAAGRAISALADLSDRRVLLNVPHVEILAVPKLSSTLGKFIEGEVATVYQIFSGAVDGSAMIMLDYSGAVQLVDLIAGNGHGPQPHLDESRTEVFTEIGNILLNATMSAFGDILEKRITFSVPKIHLNALDSLIHSMTIDNHELQEAMIAYTLFKIETVNFAGYLVVIMSVTSLEKLITALDAG
ncbi:MAG: chemotaxis protein CheC [Candidatus Promineifilaceae bacterium]